MAKSPAHAPAVAEPDTLWIRPRHQIAHGYEKLAPGRAVELPAEAARYYVAVRWADEAMDADPDPEQGPAPAGDDTAAGGAGGDTMSGA